MTCLWLKSSKQAQATDQSSIFLTLGVYFPIRCVADVHHNLNGVHNDFWVFMS